MKNNPKEKIWTTISINNALINICKNKNIDLKQLIRNTYQFIMYIENYHTEKDVNILLHNIFEEYDIYEYIPLEDSSKLIKTYSTLQQQKSYNKIRRENRVLYFNKLISIVINNTNYANIVLNKKIINDPIINSFTIKYFTSQFADSKVLIIIMESIIAKLDNFLKNSNYSDSLYSSLYYVLYNKEEAEDASNQYVISKFLLEEFKKIYFSMLVVFDIPDNTKSSKGKAREVKSKYKTIFKKKYENNINLFIQNEIRVDNEMNQLEQFHEVVTFIESIFRTESEKQLLHLSILPYYSDLIALATTMKLK